MKSKAKLIELGIRIAAVTILSILILAAPAMGEKTMKKNLEVGDEAPRFELIGSDGRIHSLSDHLGKRPVVIAWFPKAFTGG